MVALLDALKAAKKVERWVADLVVQRVVAMVYY